jgi:tripartite-type tricarboxylate transporter receptor subunit TctC
MNANRNGRWLRFGTLVAGSAALLAGAVGQGWAQSRTDYPVRPIRVIVGFPPGQATDVVARLVSQRLADAVGQQVVVDNRPGKGGSIGAELGSKATPDGYTIVLSATAPLATNPHLYKNVGYDPLKDFAPITLTGWLPFMLVTNASSPTKSLVDFIALAKSKPGQLNYGSSGNGSTSHLTMELMLSMGGLKLNHVPYKGVVAAMTDLVGGQLHAIWDTALFLTPHIKGGRVLAIASSSTKRLASFPDVPAAAEVLPGFESGAFLAFVAPAGTPAPIIRRLNTEIVRILKTQDVIDRMNALASDVLTSTPEELRAYMKREYDKWGKVVRETGARAE